MARLLERGHSPEIALEPIAGRPPMGVERMTLRAILYLMLVFSITHGLGYASEGIADAILAAIVLGALACSAR